VPEFIDIMDICVIPGSNEYRSPIKLFEYMAMAKAVVAPSYQPIESIVRDGEDGILFKPADRGSLKASLEYLIADEKKRSYIGMNARKKILGSYLWKHNAGKILDIYKKVLKSD